MPRITKTDKEEFANYLRDLTDQQVRDVLEKETNANRKVYIRLAQDEMTRRGLS